MAANKYIAIIAGKLKEVFATVVSTGVTNANQIVALDSGGHLDPSVLPTGVGADVVVAPSSENLTAGQFVNVYNNTGALNVRKADATNNTKPCHGFVLVSVTSPANATVYLLGSLNNQQSGLTIGSDYWLDTTPGGITTTSPTTSGNISQFIGRALATTTIQFSNESTVEIA